jgi:hypothetical protein
MKRYLLEVLRLALLEEFPGVAVAHCHHHANGLAAIPNVYFMLRPFDVLSCRLYLQLKLPVLLSKEVTKRIPAVSKVRDEHTDSRQLSRTVDD